MIEGRIDMNLEAFIELDVLLERATTPQRFLVDTGFNGFISVSQELVDQLGLKLLDVQEGITADGRRGYFDTVEITVLWHGESRTMQAQILDEALIGTRLLRGSRIRADWVRDGTFVVEPIHS